MTEKKWKYFDLCQFTNRGNRMFAWLITAKAISSFTFVDFAWEKITKK